MPNNSIHIRAPDDDMSGGRKGDCVCVLGIVTGTTYIFGEFSASLHFRVDWGRRSSHHYTLIIIIQPLYSARVVRKRFAKTIRVGFALKTVYHSARQNVRRKVRLGG